MSIVRKSDFQSRIHPDQKFISVQEAMLITGLSRTTIYELRNKNKIKWCNPVGRTVRIVKKSLLDFMESNSTQF